MTGKIIAEEMITEEEYFFLNVDKKIERETKRKNNEFAKKVPEVISWLEDSDTHSVTVQIIICIAFAFILWFLLIIFANV